MNARIPSVSLLRWGRTSLVLALAGLPLFASCTSSEDTEPFVPAAEGAKQPSGQGSLVTEAEACDTLLTAANAAYKRLHCEPPQFPDCPGFLRPGGGSGCYDYYEDSVTACVKAYGAADSCRDLSPCLATAEMNDTLPTCERTGGEGGSAGTPGSTPGGASSGGAASPAAGSPSASGAPAAAGQAAGGSP